MLFGKSHQNNARVGCKPSTLFFFFFFPNTKITSSFLCPVNKFCLKRVTYDLILDPVLCDSVWHGKHKKENCPHSHSCVFTAPSSSDLWQGHTRQPGSGCQRQWLVVRCHGGWRSRLSLVSSNSFDCWEKAASWGPRGRL